MRATTRITWLLLSISILFHNVCSDGDATTTVKSTDSVESTPSATSTAATNENVTTTTPVATAASKKNEQTQPTTPTKPTTAVTTPPVTTTATPKPTDKTSPTQSPTVTSTSISSAPHTEKNNVTTATAVLSTPPTPTPTPAATANRSGSSVTSPNVPKVQTPEAPVSNQTSGTQAPVNGTTKITKVTAAPAPGQQTMTHTTIITKTSQDHKGGAEKTTVTVTIHAATASKAPEPTGTQGTTTAPSTPTRAGPPAAATPGTKAGTTPPPTTATTTTTTTTTVTTTTAAAQPSTFSYSLNTGHEKEDKKDLVEVCRRLMVNLQDGNCTLTYQHHNGKILFDCVEINGKVKTTLANQYYDEITKKPTDNKTLIAILASCGALLIMIVILAVCASHHRKPYHENQQHLTEELHTVENGYHDNPTLEVMEVQPEMQEKKMALNGEFNDSWIVPIDNLLKEDIPDEEDTHL